MEDLVNVVIDCSGPDGPTERVVPLTTEERARVEEVQRGVAERAAADEKAAGERKAALAVIEAKAAKDPAFAALSRLLSA